MSVQSLLWWVWTEVVTKWASFGYHKRLTRGVLLLPDKSVRWLWGADLRRLEARARYCPREIARTAGGDDDVIGSKARRCTLAAVATFRKAVLCVEWTEPGELRPRYHVATDDDDGIAMPPWSYEQQRLVSSIRSCGITPKNGSAMDCTRDIKSMTRNGKAPPIEVATYLLWLLQSSAAGAGPPSLSDCEFWCHTHPRRF